VRAARFGEIMNNLRNAIAGILAIFVIQNAHAADITAGDTIIVSATRTEIPLDDAIVPVKVITRDDIELSLATDLAELLRFEAGIDIGRNGGPGQATSIFMRGTESNHTLVLIDGVRINPGTLGGAAVQNIAPGLIERVEIVKGARSALFGTDAIGGVINVITRRVDSPYVEAGIGGGSFNSQSAHVAGGIRGDDTEFGVTLNWQDTDGYAPRVDSDIKRGYDNLSVGLSASKEFSSSEISARHWQTEGKVEYLDFFLSPVDQDFKNSATALQLDSRFSAKGTGKFIVSHIADEIQQNQSPDFVKSERISLDWQYTHAIDNHTLTGGLYLVDENARSLSFGSGFDEDTTVRAVFVQDQLYFDRHRAFLAVRFSDHETFGGKTTWNAEYAFDMNDDWTINAGLGHAFRAPDATDRFGFGGNPNLNPEVAGNAQLGLRYSAGTRHQFDIEAYANDIEDLIEFDFATFTLVNVGKAEIRGVQLGYEFSGDAFTLRTELVRQKADNASTGTRLLRRAEKSASISYTQNIGRHKLGVSVLASGDREDFGGRKLGSYAVLNLTGQLQLGSSWQLNARIENLFDEKYQTSADYRMQELSGFVELKYRWQ
jgi:vitamin B12 transporter